MVEVKDFQTEEPVEAEVQTEAAAETVLEEDSGDYQVKVDIDVTSDAMFDFLIHAQYTSIGGLFGTALGAVTLVMGINCLIKGQTQGAIFTLLVAVYFLAIVPLSLKIRSKEKVSSSIATRIPITFCFGEEGILISQEDQSYKHEWPRLVKALTTKKSLLIYSTKKAAMILPFEQLGDKKDEILAIVKKNMPANKVKFR